MTTSSRLVVATALAGAVLALPALTAQTTPALRADAPAGAVPPPWVYTINTPVPPGSISRGEALVTTGGGTRTIACGVCHGADLKGLGAVPPLAGRSPSYTVRQLFDLQHGTRRGPWAPLMRAAVQKLTLDDMVAIAAYTASREP